MAEQVSELKAEVEEMRRKMAEMEKKHREELSKVEEKRQHQDQILFQVMENATVSNKELAKVEEEMRKMKFGESSTKTVENDVTDFSFKTSSVDFQQMTAFDLIQQNDKFKQHFTWKIDEIQKKLKRQTFAVKSPEFAWPGYPRVGATVKIELKADGDVYLSTCLKENYPEKASYIKIIPKIFYVLKDQSGSGRHKAAGTTYLFKSKFNRSLPFEQQLVDKSYLSNPLYNANDSVVIQVCVEPPNTDQLVRSYDGALSWAIDRYSRRKRMAVDDLMGYYESPYFYTGPKGYRMQVIMHLDGRGEHRGKGMVAQVSFMTGEFDYSLPMAFAHRTIVALCNRKEPSKNVVKSVHKEMGEKSRQYFIYLCSDKEIESLLENNALFYKVTVQPI